VTAPLAYLSGAIEHAADGGTGWRRKMGAFLREELGHGVYDPAADEKKDLSEEELAGFRDWKLAAPDRFRGVLRKIIAWDLGWIESRADYVIALWDEAAARGGGTSAEITLAHRLGKPVYLVLGMPRAAASGWALACATEVFDDFEQLKRFLRTDDVSPIG
jgi:nucleoside 2-deoxyribosyltransferase